MFARAFKSTVVVSVIAFLEIAGAVPTSTTTNQCNNGELSCCNQLFNSTDPQYAGLLGILGLGSILGELGLLCTPINVLGLGNGAVCNQQAACCDNVVQEGLINAGCTPVSLNL